ncbi:hypothetical protein PQG76_07115 [Corynebacterium falsenii]|uniref:hypothetical protein n=1 Tax=Corynebacterium falsenii TaxID=108486 RepID=UPI001CCCCC24|nr:hypothetical protein [Corynebacterium falsenii]MDC7104273.1 hypothetical protein [Corynebacterium falsenii]UBI06814.1 hypothetical protein LA329_00320 [Corynebacterium falsenii]
MAPRQEATLLPVLVNEDYVHVYAAWEVYQTILASYRDKNRRGGMRALARDIAHISTGVPVGLKEIATLGRALKKRQRDIPWPTSLNQAPATAPSKQSTTFSNP